MADDQNIIFANNAADELARERLDALANDAYDRTFQELIDFSLGEFEASLQRVISDTASTEFAMGVRRARQFNEEIEAYQALAGELGDAHEKATTIIDASRTIYEIADPNVGDDEDFGNPMVNAAVQMAKLPDDAAKALQAGLDIVGALPFAGDLITLPLETLVGLLERIAEVTNGPIESLKANYSAMYREHGPSLVINDSVELHPTRGATGNDQDLNPIGNYRDMALLFRNPDDPLQSGDRDRECDDSGRDARNDNVQRNEQFEGRGADSDVTYVTTSDSLIVRRGDAELTLRGWIQDDADIHLSIDDARNGGQDCGQSGDGDDDGGGESGGLGGNRDRGSPIILDLDGDGIETTDVTGTSTYFDIDNDGTRERTGWVTGGDGLLAFDANGDGLIEGTTELFGAGETYNGIRAALEPAFDFQDYDIRFESGFDKLKAFDSNDDGVVDAVDDRFAALRIWVDADANGISAPEELLTLDAAEVASISVNAERRIAEIGENLQTDLGSYTTTSGEQRIAADIWFGFTQLDTRPENLTIDPDIAALPDIDGGGAMPRLQTAMQRDHGLRRMVEELTGLGVDDFAQVSPLIEAILSRWAGFDQGLGTDLSRGVFASARHVAVTEAATDTPFAQRGITEDPRPFAGATIEDEWDVLHRNVTAELIAQTDVGRVLFPELSYRGPLIDVAADTSGGAILDRLEANAPDGVLEKIAFWHAALRVLDAVSDGLSDMSTDAFRIAAQTKLDAAGLGLSYLSLLTARIGGSEADGLLLPSVQGGIFNVGVFGSGDTPRVVVGGAGDDDIRLGGGAPVVFFGEGQGNDTVFYGTVSDDAGFAISGGFEIRLPEINSADARFRIDPSAPRDLQLVLTNTGETLTIADALAPGARPVGRFVFSDTTLIQSTVLAGLGASGTADDDLLVQLGVQILDGGAGDDVLLGDPTAPTLFGFGLGSGTDVISDRAVNGSGIAGNTLQFAAEVSAASLLLARVGKGFADLEISIAGTTDRITIRDQFLHDTPAIGTFVIEGAPQTAAAFYQLFANETAGEETIFGSDRADAFVMQDFTGGDTFRGLGGADRYEFSRDSTDFDASDAKMIIVSDGGSDTGFDALFINDPLDELDFVFGADRLTITLVRNGDSVVIHNPDEIEEFGFGFTSYSLGDLRDEAERRTLISTGEAILGDINADDILTGTAESDTIFGFGGDDAIDGLAGDDVLDGGAGDDTLRGGGGDDILIGGDTGETALSRRGENQLEGGAGADLLQGGFRDDILRGGEDNDRLEGDIGDDDIAGGPGDDVGFDRGGADTWRWAPGDGFDTLLDQNDFSSVDRLILGGDVTPDRLSFRFVTFDAAALVESPNFTSDHFGLEIAVDGVAAIRAVDGIFSEIGGLETLGFENGAADRAFAAILAEMRMASAENQTIVGSYAAFGDTEVFDGGAGDDVLAGLGGPDEYLFAPGSGNDVILPTFSLGDEAIDKVTFGGGLSPSDVAFTRNGEDLTATLNTGESLTMTGQFQDVSMTTAGITRLETSAHIDMFEFADGSALNAVEVLSLVGGGTAQAQTLDGDSSDERLVGGAGGDIYRLEPGSGIDEIVEVVDAPLITPYDIEADAPTDLGALRSEDVLRFGDGIDLADLEIAMNGIGLTDMTVTIRETGDQVVIPGQLAAESGYGRIDAASLPDFALGDEQRALLGAHGEITAEFWNAPVFGAEAMSYAETYGQAPLFRAGIERFEFADGTAFDRDEFAALATLRDDGGENTLRTGDGGGLLDGGPGNDDLQGGIGGDAFVLSLGTGDDVARDEGGLDELRLGEGIAPGMIAFSRTGPDGGDLLIEIGGNDRSAMTIEGQFSDPEGVVESLVFQDGSRIFAAAIESQILRDTASGGSDAIQDFAGSEIIVARGGDDAIRLSTGDDYVSGGLGRDTVHLAGQEGDWQITIDDAAARVVAKSDVFGVKTLDSIERIVFEADGHANIFAPDALPVAKSAQFTISEDRPLVLRTVDLIGLATDSGGDVLSLIGVENSINGTAVIEAGRVTFTPEPDFSGTGGFDYRVTDSSGQEASAHIDITIEAVNDAPVVKPLSFAATEDTPLTIGLDALLAGADDVDGDDLSILSVAGGSSLDIARDPDGVTVTPAENFAGETTFQVRVGDGQGAEAVIPVTIAFAPVNDAPEIISLAPLDVPGGATQRFDTSLLLADVTDPDGDALEVISVGAGINGTVLHQGNSIAFTPSAGFEGMAQLSYTVADGKGGETTSDLVFNVVADTDAGPLEGTPDADTLRSRPGADLVRLGAGADTLAGTLAELNDDTVADFAEEDRIVFLEQELPRSAFNVARNPLEIGVDSNADGVADGRLNLEGDFTGGHFLTVTGQGDTALTFETYLPTLEEATRVAPDAINGIVNEEYLTGDGSKTFRLAINPEGAAGYNNAVGVYEIRPDGALVDARLLVENANTAKGTSTIIDNVEAGHRLGFFLVQNGANWVSALQTGDTLSFVDDRGAPAALDSGVPAHLAVNDARTFQTVFHSFSRHLNTDGQEHVLSGVNAGGTGLVIGFEDLVGGGDGDYQDVVIGIDIF